MIHLDQAADPSYTLGFDLRDRGLLLADGVFDTAMVIGGRIVFAEKHRARLLADAAALGVEVEPARVDAAYAAASKDLAFGSVRVTVTRGPGARGLAPSPGGRATVLASGAPGDPARTFAPVRIAPCTIRRNETSPASRHKTLAYLDAVLAMREAAARGAEEALLLNTQGRLACCAAGNIFVLAGSKLTTPPAEEGAMGGVTRAWVLENARRAGLEAAEAAISAEEAAVADAAFLTSSLRLIASASGVARSGAPLQPEPLAALTRLLCDDLRAEGFAPPFGSSR